MRNLPKILLKKVFILCTGLITLFGARQSYGHGGLGHIQVTAWAAENLPQGELRQFLAHPEVFNILLFGAAYPDFGYYPSVQEETLALEIGQYSHWAPFIEDFVEWIRIHHPPPWTTLESQKRVAFLMGCAAHGFQDEVFDTLFLPQVRYHDNSGQKEADSGTDGFLAMDALVNTIPEGDIPVDVLLALYNKPGLFDKEVTEELLLSWVDTMTTLYVGEGVGSAISQIAANQYLNVLKWTRENYMEADIPGSLRAEIFPTARYLEALWKRLHGEYSDKDVVVFSYPESPRRLRSHLSKSPDSWVSFILGSGINHQTVDSFWKDSSGENVGFSRAGVGWGGKTYARIMKLSPKADLIPGAHYSVVLKSDATGTGDKIWKIDYATEFQVACGAENPNDCPDLGEFPQPKIDGHEAFKSEWPSPDPIVEEEVPDNSGCSNLRGNLTPLLCLVVLMGAVRRNAKPLPTPINKDLFPK